LAWVASKVENPWVAQEWRSKFDRIGSAMTMLAKVQMPSLVSTMSTCQWKELNVVEGNACNYFRPTWKSTFHPMPTKVSQIASWVLVSSLPWAQCKRWIPIKLMGCVHTHQGMHVIEGWGSPSHIQNVCKKMGKIIKRLTRLVEL